MLLEVQLTLCCVIIKVEKRHFTQLDIFIYEGLHMRWITMVLLVLLAGCSSPSLVEKDGSLLGIAVDGGTVTVNAKKIKEDRIGLDNLSVKRSLFMLDNGGYIVYELAMTQPPYAYSYDVKQSLRLIFKADKVTQLERTGNLGFYEMAFSDGKVLLAIAENMNKKGIKMVYGLTKSQMSAAIKKVGGTSSVDIASIAGVSMLPGTEEAFLSRWVPNLIILDGLIYRMGGKPVMG